MRAATPARVMPAIVLLQAIALFSPSPSAASLALWSDDFEDNNTSCWTLANNGATIALDPAVGNSGTHSLRVIGNAMAGRGATATSRSVPVDTTRDYTVRCAFKYSSFHWNRFFVFGHIRLLLDYPNLPLLYDPVGNNSFVGNRVSNSSFDSYLAASTWGWITVHCRPSLRQYTVFVNGTLMGTVSYNTTVVPSLQFWFEDNHSGTNYLDAHYDDFSVEGYEEPQAYASPPRGIFVDPENNAAHWAQPPLVPFHGQYTIPGSPLSEPCCPNRPNGRCVVACLQMLFDRFGDILPVGGGNFAGPQEEIEAAANTNDRDSCPGAWKGTYITDGRRAAHFSSLTQAATAIRAGCPPVGCPQAGGGNWGYTWRSLGYSAVDSIWTDVAPSDDVDTTSTVYPSALDTFLASGYPIVAFISTQNYLKWLKADQYEGFVDTTSVSPETDNACGHAVLLVGFDNAGTCPGNPWSAQPWPGKRRAFLIHDPAVAKYAWIPQAVFWDQVWTSKRFIFAAPWELKWLAAPAWCYSGKEDGSLLVTYTGAEPLDGLFPVQNAQAKLTLTNGGLQGGEVQTHNLANISSTGDWDFSTWKVQWGGWIGNPLVATAATAAWGTLNPSPSSHSYVGYADKLGGAAIESKGLTVCLQIQGPDAGHDGWPYGDDWWSHGGFGDFGGGGGGGGAGSTGIEIRKIGQSQYEVYATVANYGTGATPAGGYCEFSYRDPNAAERAGAGSPFGLIPIPSLPPGDSLTVGPVFWTSPPANSFGEPFFSFFSTIHSPGEMPQSDWPQGENNHAALGEFSMETDIGAPVGMTFAVENPETGPMEVVLRIDREEGAEDWSATLSLPEGVPIPLGPGQMIPCRATVTPTVTRPLGRVDVECFLYTPSGVLVRETGGITLCVRVRGASHVSREAADGPSLELAPARPNPFGDQTTIRYALPRDGEIDLRVFDVNGRLVKTLFAGHRAGGWHQETWSSRNDAGMQVASGIYYCRLTVDGGQRRARSIVLLR
ncbi:MAG: T9SS type A sorting domain-containing protein [Candidatus Eisenbacteria bacterium]|nr:T9SS type A sorting domain-containing protein [Candidatus Eisenbacteria bacterium]